MKIVGTMNGWKEAPHHWWRYLLLPFGIERIPGYWTSISLFGFVVFVGPDEPSVNKVRDRAFDKILRWARRNGTPK